MLRPATVLLALVPSAAIAQDVSRGQELAQRWCSSCHVVERAAARAPADAVPTFLSIAGKPGDTLRAAMTPLHGRMPDLSLSKQQQDDLIAYIRSLRQG